MVMEEPSLLRALLPTLVVSMVVALLLLKLIKGRKLPPGPLKLPIIGHLHLIGKIPHRNLYSLSRVHGPLMWLQLGRQSVIVASSSAAAQEILQTHDQLFSSRPRLSVPSSLHGCGDILFASPATNPHWKLVRQLCFNHLFSKKQFEAFHVVRAQEVHTLLRSILLSVGAPITVRAHTHALASNIICRMVFGKRLPELVSSSQVHPSHNIINLTVEMNTLLGVFNINDYFPWLAWLDLQGYGRESRALAKKFAPVLQEIIEGHLHNRNKRNSDETKSMKSFFDFLIDAASHDEDENKNGSISYDNVKAVTMNMFGGGFDTSALTIEWALVELLANPTKMRKLQEELDQVVGTSRIVEESDLCGLPYLQAVVKETMRLHPVVPLLAPHLTLQECEVLGYKIPANTMAYVNVWAIGRDPSTWESPFEFLPERFLGKDIDVSGKCFELLPFGSGRRGCPGWMLGLVTVQIAVASLVQGFDWTPAEELTLSDADGLVMTTATLLIAHATPKLPRDLFTANI